MAQPHKPIKVCHLLDNLRPGIGVTQIAFDLMTDPNVETCGIFLGKGEIDPRFAEPGIALKAIQSTSGILHEIWRLRTQGYRIIHVHSRHAAPILMIANLLGFRIIRTQHFGTLPKENHKAPLPKRLALRLRNTLSFKTGWIAHWAAISETSRKYIQSRWGIPNVRITRIYNGIDTHKFQPLSEDERRAIRSDLEIPLDAFVVVSVGSLLKRKRHDLTIDVFEKLHRKNPKSRFLILGNDGSERTNLENQISKAGLGDQIKLLGLRTDVNLVLGASDVLIHSAIDEAFGLVVAEGMAAGLPAIVFSGFGPSEIVRDSENGLVVSKSDLNAMSEALISVSSYPDVRSEMGRTARLDAETRFSLQAMRREYTELYRKLGNLG